MFPFPCYTFRESLRSKNENSPVPTSKIISKFPFLWLLPGYLLQLLDAVLHRLTPSLAHQEACRQVLSVRRPRCRRSGHQRIATRPNRPTGHSAQRRHAPNDLITRGSRRNPAPGATNQTHRRRHTAPSPPAPTRSVGARHTRPHGNGNPPVHDCADARPSVPHPGPRRCGRAARHAMPCAASIPSHAENVAPPPAASCAVSLSAAL